ncbi:TetR family transcriptional regulator [Aquabacterium sp. OR-4]|uniref:TetR family transcriptional regulator n=1 Tax=Aquabacterium sp. OR-4 TaxID=2978127 RepID=UPI0021B39317|nr:TetR family transcriptional regulator [Aquabacterium sp. OR-4]MDT7835653.1 TetR family transcriptional regulator [Aquabacterium sp. OR-4]
MPARPADPDRPAARPDRPVTGSRRVSADGRAGPAAPLAEAPRGVRQAKQLRSQRKHQALLDAGRTLLATQDLPSLSVAQVAAAAGVAVGSFYTRFDDKNAWFAELCREAGATAFDELQQLLASATMQRAGTARQVMLLMQWLVQVHRVHQGIFRAAVSEPARTHLYWGPLMRLCNEVVDLVYARLGPELDGVPRGQRRRRVGFAFQMVFSTLVNAVLHDGGPVRLHDAALARELARSFLALVGAGPAAGVKAAAA